MAAVRTATLAELDQLKKIIEAEVTLNGQMPNAQQIMTALHPEGLKIRKHIEDKVIILTGTSKKEDIWAYTAQPHSVAGEHLYISGSAAERISRADLDQRLKQQGLPPVPPPPAG
jgi:hypothetical protein